MPARTLPTRGSTGERPGTKKHYSIWNRKVSVVGLDASISAPRLLANSCICTGRALSNRCRIVLMFPRKNKKGASIAHALSESNLKIAEVVGRALTLGVLRPFARLVTPIFLALDLARIAGQHPALAQHRTQRLGHRDQCARDSESHRVG